MEIKTFKNYCCDSARRQIDMFCDYHKDKCPDRVFSFYKGYKDETINIKPEFRLSSANSSYSLNFCPWCGVNLKKFYNYEA